MNIDPSLLYSVRTTFRISKEAEKILDELTNRYDITQKELMITLMVKYPNITINNINNASNLEKQTKTKVLAKQVLQFIEKRAKELETHRDLVFEALVMKASSEAKTENENIRIAMDIVDRLWKETERSKGELKSLLGDNHPAVSRIELIDVVVHNFSHSLENYIKFGSPIDPDDLSDTGYASDKVNEGETKQETDQTSIKEYLKIYKSAVANTSKSLDQKIPLSRIKHLPPFQKHLKKIEKYSSLNFWDFGVKASEYLEPDDTVWIRTGDTLYKGVLVTIIEDESGEIGDSIGWARQFKAPWKNVAILINVEKVNRTPIHLQPYIRGVKQSLIPNFYKIED